MTILNKALKDSIQFRFLSVLSFVLFINTSALSYLIAVNERDMLRHSLITKGHGLASYMAKLSQDPLIMKDNIELDSIVNEANNDEDILYTIIHNAQGQLVTSQYASVNYKSPRMKLIISGLTKESDLQNIISTIQNKEASTEISVPIKTGTDTIGKVSISMSHHNINKQIMKTALVVIALNFFGAFILGTVLFIVSKKIILTPITALASATDRLARGDLSSRVDIKTTGEVQMLINGFNQMAEDLMRTTVSKNYVDNIIKSIIDTLLVTSPEGKILRTNDAACKLLGYEENELVGQSIGQIFYKGLSDKDSRVSETSLERDDSHIEAIYQAKDGRKIPVLSSASAIRDANDRVQGIVYVARDITLRKNAEREIIDARRAAEDANKLKSGFLANMSHEIRTPMNGIIGMAEIGLESVINEDQRNIFSAIKKEADVLNEIINDILDLSKIEAGKIELEEIPLDLRMLIADLSDVFSYRCIQKNLTLESSGCMDVKTPHLVLGDPTRLRQIFVNLMGNAIKFTPEGGKISIGCELAGDSADNAMYKFLVSDTGIGIPKDKHGLIFKPFTQVDGSTTRKYGGTGLGTTIAKQLVELMGGELGLESEPGMGSTFWFVIPLKKQRRSSNVVIERASDLKDYTICLVSDTKQCPGTLDDLLLLGCTPLQATILEAPAMLGKFREGNRMPDLIILDCELPETDIFTHAGDIRHFLADDAVPLMIMMRRGTRGDGKRCREEVIQAYLTKPVKRSDLLRAIIQVISDRKTGNTAAPVELVTKYSLKERYGASRRILLVEDYPTNQKIALIHLQSQAVGCDVDLAENGEQAVSAFERKAYDLIFMDVQMPVMDGYEAVRNIRQREHKMNAGGVSSPFPRKARTPIIAMTAHAMTGDREKCLAAGMDDYIAKPIRKAELLHMVDKWLGVQQSLPTATAPDESVPERIDDTSDPLDLEATIKEFEGNRTMVSTIIQEFLDDVNAQIVKMSKGVSSGELEIVRKEAHSIKGGAANINARDLSLAACNLEQAAKASEASTCGDLLQYLSREAQRVNAYVTDLRARGLF